MTNKYSEKPCGAGSGVSLSLPYFSPTTFLGAAEPGAAEFKLAAIQRIEMEFWPLPRQVSSWKGSGAGGPLSTIVGSYSIRHIRQVEGQLPDGRQSSHSPRTQVDATSQHRRRYGQLNSSYSRPPTRRTPLGRRIQCHTSLSFSATRWLRSVGKAT